MFEGEAAILSELIRERNLISPEQLAEIQEEHERTGKPLSQVIVDFGLMSEEQLLRAVADHLSLEYVNLEDLTLEQAVLRRDAQQRGAHVRGGARAGRRQQHYGGGDGSVQPAAG